MSRVTLFAFSLVLASFPLLVAEAQAQVTDLDTTNASALTAAQAMSAPGMTIAGAAWVSNPANGAAGVSSGQISAGFPRSGFLILSTGWAGAATHPGWEQASYGPGWADTAHSGGAGFDVYDTLTLKISVNVPARYNCLGFNFQFLSDELPSGSGSEDHFFVELDGTNGWRFTSPSTFVAPDNVPIGIPPEGPYVDPDQFVSGQEAGSVYDSATTLNGSPWPSSVYPMIGVTPGPHSIYFTVFDAGWGGDDSAVFLADLHMGVSSSDGCVTPTYPQNAVVIERAGAWGLPPPQVPNPLITPSIPVGPVTIPSEKVGPVGPYGPAILVYASGTCVDARTGAVVHAGSTLTTPNPSVSCWLGAAQFGYVSVCGSVLAGGLYDSLGTVGVTTRCDGPSPLSVTQSLTTGGPAGASSFGMTTASLDARLGWSPWKCDVNDSGAGANPVYVAVCAVNAP